ncbi:MAG TPA: site-specific DNA-methyltransferase [Anaerolineales bacterium]|nr:site-specific DNA-methyltransferase [Anaerolineales bacterium]
MAKRPFVNRLNNLDPKTWLKFQKSWFIHAPPPRKKGVMRHPAKFPETLAQQFIEFFTKEGQVILDPMVGTGSSLVAALRSGRSSIGIELNPTYVDIANQAVESEQEILGDAAQHLSCQVIQGNALNISRFFEEYRLPAVNYVLTSPPYWDMLHAKGAQTQKKRRATAELDLHYSDNPEDLGNLHDYDQFLEKLVNIYTAIKPYVLPRGYITIIVKNIKKGGKIYPLAWDIARELGDTYTLKDEKIWCQDDIRLAPYGLGNAWVSNTFHHYCLQFRNE